MQKNAFAGLSGSWAREHCFPLGNTLMFLVYLLKFCSNETSAKSAVGLFILIFPMALFKAWIFFRDSCINLFTYY